MNSKGTFSKFISIIGVALISAQPVLAYDFQFYANNNIFFYNEDAICTTDSSTDQNVSIDGKGDVATVLNYLVSKGMTLEGAAGAAGNMQVESGFDPKNVQNSYENDRRNVEINGGGDAKAAPLLSNGKVNTDKMYKPIDNIGFGLSQWTNGGTPGYPETWGDRTGPDRQTFLYQMALDQKRDIADIGLQLDFLWSELQGGYKTSTLDKIMNSTDVREAAKIYMINYEGPRDQSEAAQNSRADFAEAIYDRYKGKITSETADTSNVSAGDSTADPVPYKNPVIDDYSAAPAVIQGDDGTYHAFTTGFRHYTSNNLVDWKLKQDRDSSWIKGGYPDWVNKDHWVPDVTKTGDKYTFVYTSGSPKRIGYATSASPTPPFDKSGDGVLVAPLTLNHNKYATIDPFLLDDGGGNYILYFGSNKYDNGIQAIKYKLVGDNLEKVSGPSTAMKGDYDGDNFYTNEAAYVIKRDGYYYLFYSAGTPSEGRYEIRVARSRQAIGEYEKPAHHKPILTSGNGFVAPGQNSVITDGAGRDWIVYHAVKQGGDFADDRRMMIDPIEWVNGWPKVRDGHPSSGRQLDGPVPGIGSSTADPNADCSTSGSGGGLGSVDGFTFPLETTKADIKKGTDGSIWCYQSQTNCHHDYNAADIHVETGTPIIAAVGGKVISAQRDCTVETGCNISIRGDDGKLYYYTHMNKEAVVEDNAKVSAGQKIGAVGTNETAVNTARHLHFDMMPPVSEGGPEFRPSCSSEGCTEYPFIDVQPLLVASYEKLPEGE